MIAFSNGKSAKANSSLEKTEEQLKQAGMETILFDEIMANPLKLWRVLRAQGRIAVIFH